MTERWLPVVGYEHMYEVSDHGRVRILARHRDDGRFYKLRNKAQSVQNGYPAVSLYIRKQGKRAYVHRLVSEAFIGPCPEGFEVNHKDGNKVNSHLSNLEYVTRSENQKHAVRLGLRPLRTAGAFQKGNVPWNKSCYLSENKLLPPL